MPNDPEKNRKWGRAIGRAQRELAKRHPDEFRELLTIAKTGEGLSTPPVGSNEGEEPGADYAESVTDDLITHRPEESA